MASEQLLDTAQFTATLDLRAIRVPKDKCQSIMKMLKGKCLDRPRMKSVVVDPADDSSRLILLHESVKSPGESKPLVARSRSCYHVVSVGSSQFLVFPRSVAL